MNVKKPAIWAAGAATLGLLSASIFAALPAGAADISLASGTTRLAGDSRYETAIAVSQLYSSGVSDVFVTTGENFPDALAASAAAADRGVPLLLTPSGSLPANVLAEVRRLAPKNIRVIGGPGAVSDTVLAALQAVAPTTRTGGTDRYDTGRKVVAEFFDNESTVFVATGSTFPDALTASAAAGAKHAPVVLVNGTRAGLSDTEKALLQDTLKASTAYIAGGTGAVSSGIEADMRALGLSVSRYGGASRYETAVAINQKFFPAGSTNTMFLATGLDFPDALAGAALAGRLGAPLYITSSACVPAAPQAAIAAFAPAKRVVLGGVGAVSASAALNTSCAASTPDPAPSSSPSPTTDDDDDASPSPSTSSSTKPKPGADVLGMTCDKFDNQQAAQDWYAAAKSTFGAAQLTTASIKPDGQKTDGSANNKVCTVYFKSKTS